MQLEQALAWGYAPSALARAIRHHRAERDKTMHRMTISLEESLAQEFDALVERKGYQNRSEAVRDLIRNHLEEERLREAKAPYCIASVSYVYNHHERELPRRLMAIQHQHHDLSLSTMHVHLDHDQCMETVVLRGRTSSVRQFAEAIVAERGIRHGKINIVPMERESPRSGVHGHVHYHPKT
jgi:CopG family nickel-responsive transcriptional regulator